MFRLAMDGLVLQSELQSAFSPAALLQLFSSPRPVAVVLSAWSQKCTYPFKLPVVHGTVQPDTPCVLIALLPAQPLVTFGNVFKYREEVLSAACWSSVC